MRCLRHPVLLVFLGTLTVYNLNLRFIGALDSRPSRLLPVSLLTTGTLHLDRFEPTFPTNPAHRYWFVPSRHGHLVSLYPVVVPIAVTPVFIPAALVLAFESISSHRFFVATEVTEKVSASLIAAASAAVMFLLLQRVARPRVALLLTVTYAFATETWIIGSQALWQHGMAELLLAGTLLTLLTGTPAALALAGMLSGLLVANRPTDGLFALSAAAYVVVHYRRRFLPFLCWAAAAFAPFAAYNYAQFAHPFGGYGLAVGRYMFQSGAADWLTGTAGLLLSPAKGLLLFAPVFVFMPGSLWAPVKPALARLLILFLPAAGLQLLIFGGLVLWSGGSCYGPRYLTDMMPVLILALVPVAEALRRPWTRALFVALVAFGIGVQAIGAFCYPTGGSDANADLWSFRNLTYLTEARARLLR